MMKGLAKSYLSTRAQTEELCKPLEIEDYVVQPIEDVSPPKWHLAHTTWFFENFILKKDKSYKVYDDLFFYLFNSYYEHEGERWKRPERGYLTRPTVKEVYQYRAYVDERMRDLISRLDTEKDTEMINTIELGINHEQQHQELLLTDLKYILCHNPLKPVYSSQKILKSERQIANKGYLSFEGGVHDIGYTGGAFCFDNEKPVNKVRVNDFSIASSPVINKEYIEFIDSGGYNDFRHWLMEGWEWRKANNINAPMYWHKEGTNWYEMTLNGYQKLDLSSPVTHISFYEAEAYATWKNHRLPTEFEWEVAANSLNIDMEECNFLESKTYHPQTAIYENYDSDAVTNFLGNAWEWTGSSYLPYHGYKQAEGALGEYNGKFMINQMVLRGGSCATARDHIRTTYRNFFHADKRWQFTGIRLAKTE